MNTKTCKKCGWVFPAYTDESYCRFCGEAFTEGICISCGEFSTDLVPKTRLCRKCYVPQKKLEPVDLSDNPARSVVWNRRAVIKADKRFKEWTDKLRQIKMPSLTEDEWMEACIHFDGCAVCNSKSIDARSYFIRYEDGGRYNACNVIPMCEVCATAFKYQHNPFRQMNPNLNANIAVCRGISNKKLEAIAEYLQVRMEVALHEQ